MKQLFISLLLLGSSLGLFAQTRSLDNNISPKRDELKINLPVTILASFPMISYERVLQEDISIGASVGVNLDKNKMPYNWLFVPYARWFFGGNRASMQKAGTGFFIEVNGGLLNRISEERLIGKDEVNPTKSSFGAGLGLGIGWKYLTKNNWVGEVFYGAGRDFTHDSIYPHFGVSIGKRF